MFDRGVIWRGRLRSLAKSQLASVTNNGLKGSKFSFIDRPAVTRKVAASSKTGWKEMLYVCIMFSLDDIYLSRNSCRIFRI